MVVVRRAAKRRLRAKGRERSLILREQLSGTGLWKCRDYKGLVRKEGEGAADEAGRNGKSDKRWGRWNFLRNLIYYPTNEEQS